MQELIDAAPERSERVEPDPRPQTKEMWCSRATGRRGVIGWATSLHVHIVYDEGNPKACKTHTMKDFLRLYAKV